MLQFIELLAHFLDGLGCRRPIKTDLGGHLSELLAALERSAIW
ncbi:MAG: hypothetical protein ACLFVJ_13545 [Persicimonas sp.]